MFKITSVKTKKVENGNGRLVGLARVIIDRAFVINDIRIIQGNEERGMFIAFPSRKQSNGEFKDECHPIDKNVRKMFEEDIISEFNRSADDKDDISNN